MQREARPVLRHFLYQSLASLLGLLALMVSPAQSAEVESTDEADFLRTREIRTRPVQLTELYASMKGPRSTRTFNLDPTSESEILWIRRFGVDVLNVTDEVESTEFLCHAWLIGDAGLNDATPKEGLDLYLTISQGMEEMQFPDGFAVQYDQQNIDRLSFMAMAVNNNYDEIDKQIQFRASIDYLEDHAAKRLGIKALSAVMIGGRRENKIHWTVPPGEQVLVNDIEPDKMDIDATVHFIKLHLHPHGQSVTLRDKTTGEELWTGRARNELQRHHLLGTDSYSSTVGFRIYKDHDYELTTVYDNPTDHNIDAMSTMRLYVVRR